MGQVEKYVGDIIVGVELIGSETTKIGDFLFRDENEQQASVLNGQHNGTNMVDGLLCRCYRWGVIYFSSMLAPALQKTLLCLSTQVKNLLSPR